MPKRSTAAVRRFERPTFPKLTPEQSEELQKRLAAISRKFDEQNGRALTDVEVRGVVSETASKLHGTSHRRR